MGERLAVKFLVFEIFEKTFPDRIIPGMSRIGKRLSNTGRIQIPPNLVRFSAYFIDVNPHPGPLTYQLIKKHKCVKKRCGNLRIVPTAEYWKQKGRAKEKRIQRKEETKSVKEMEQDILDYANNTVKHMPDISFIRLRLHLEGFYYLFYTSAEYIDLTDTIKTLSKL